MMVSALPLDWSLAASRKVQVSFFRSKAGGGELPAGLGGGENGAGSRAGGLAGLLPQELIGAEEQDHQDGEDHQETV